MNIQDQIEALLAEAAPLRLLPDPEAEAQGLPGIVNKINALRAKQTLAALVPPVAVFEGENPQALVRLAESAKPVVIEHSATVEGADAVADVPAVEPEKRKPGRPKKAD